MILSRLYMAASHQRSAGHFGYHTDTLFLRALTEPERDAKNWFTDWRRWAGSGCSRGILLPGIGANYCVPQFHSPSAFSDPASIHRLLPDAKKAADYLSL